MIRYTIYDGKMYDDVYDVYDAYMMKMIYMMYICADIVPRRLLLEITYYSKYIVFIHVRSEFLFTRK